MPFLNLEVSTHLNNRNQNLLVFYLADMKDMYLSNGSYEKLIVI